MLHKQVYSYDEIGNILDVADSEDNTLSMSMQYDATFSSNNLYGAKRLHTMTNYDGTDAFEYDVLGNTTIRTKQNNSGRDKFIYNSNGLLRQFINETNSSGSQKWAFIKKYSIFGGVESEAMIHSADGSELSYDYNLKGAGGETIVRYHGVNGSGNMALLYPYEMLVNGGEITNRFDNSKSISVTGLSGNVRLVAEYDEQGNDSYLCFDYTPFGKKLSTFTMSAQELGFGNARQQMKSNYYQLGARTYDPEMGRFLQQDPLFEAFTGHSSYSYGFNNPVMFGDPSGLAPEKHKSGGGGQDRLLGSSAINDLLKDIFSSVSPLVEYRTEWRSIFYENVPLTLDKDLCAWGYGWNHTSKLKTIIYRDAYIPSGSPSAYTPSAASMNPAGMGGGGGGSSSGSANDNGRVVIPKRVKSDLSETEYKAVYLEARDILRKQEAKIDNYLKQTGEATPFMRNPSDKLYFWPQDESGVVSWHTTLAQFPSVLMPFILNDPDIVYNCHFYAWQKQATDDWFSTFLFPYWLDDPYEAMMDPNVRALASNEVVEEGDIVVYAKTIADLFAFSPGSITHSGVVANVNKEGDVMYIESKWGQGGRYLHTPGNVPAVYGEYRRYFRIKK